MIIKTSYSFMKPPPSARLIRGHRSAQGLVGAWTMAENGGRQVFDLSGNGNTGIFAADAPTWVSGNLGSALKFLTASNTHINVADSPSLTVTDFTFVLSIKRVGVMGATDRIFSKWGGAPASFYLQIGTGYKPKIYTYDGIAKSHQASIAISDTKFNQLVITLRGTTASFYFDGVFDNSGTVGIPQDSVHELRIGTDSTEAKSVDAILEYLMFYNRALNASEIALLYQEPFGMFERKARIALMSGYEVVAPPVGMAGAMTTNTGYWGY